MNNGRSKEKSGTVSKVDILRKKSGWKKISLTQSYNAKRKQNEHNS